MSWFRLVRRWETQKDLLEGLEALEEGNLKEKVEKLIRVEVIIWVFNWCLAERTKIL